MCGKRYTISKPSLPGRTGKGFSGGPFFDEYINAGWKSVLTRGVAPGRSTTREALENILKKAQKMNSFL
jgi:hypothetical protein